MVGMQPKEVLDAGSKAADTLTQTVLGSLVILFMIATGVTLWLAWKAKQGELKTVKDFLKAQGDERVAANDLALEQTKAYQDLADVVEQHSGEIGRLKDELAAAVRDGDGTAAAAIDRLGKRIDSLADSIPNVDVPKYYRGRE